MKRSRLTGWLAAVLLAGAATLAHAGQATHQHAPAAELTPTQALSHEHLVVERMADVLDAMADQAEKDGRLDAKTGDDAIDFLKGFLDRCHHAKEEQLLFPALEKQGTDATLINALRKEHDDGRAHVKAMAKALDTADATSAASIHALAEHARAYARLLRAHIETEEGKLFPAADKALPADEQERLAEGFGRIEAEETGEGIHEKYLRIVDELAARYGVKPAGEATGQAKPEDSHHAH